MCELFTNKPTIYSITNHTTNEGYAKEFVGWDSLIWTQRFGEAGDFELKTQDVENGLNALPLFAIVFIKEDNVMMMVEDHDIKGSENGDVLTVTGRTLDAAWFSGRRTVHAYVPDWLLWNAYRTPQNFLEYDVMRGSAQNSTAEPLASAAFIRDPSADALYSSTMYYATERTDVYSEITKICKEYGFGVRAIRPDFGSNIVNFIVYGEQNKENQIHLYDKLGHFNPDTSLYVSIKDEFHDVMALDEDTVRYNTPAPEYINMTDFRRRQAVIWKPNVPEGVTNKADYFDQTIASFLRTHKRQYLFECTLSPFGVESLIDAYKLIGEWDSNTLITEKLGHIFSVSPRYHDVVLSMRLDEVIRTYESSGTKVALTLSQVV